MSAYLFELVLKADLGRPTRRSVLTLMVKGADEGGGIREPDLEEIAFQTETSVDLVELFIAEFLANGILVRAGVPYRHFRFDRRNLEFLAALGWREYLYTRIGEVE